MKNYNYFDCASVCTPFDPSVKLFKNTSVKLFKNTGDIVTHNEYASIISSLRYATDCTKLDIAYNVVLCRFTSNPGIKHCTVIERVVQYLKRTVNLTLYYERFPVVLRNIAMPIEISFRVTLRPPMVVFNIDGSAIA